MKNNIEHQLKLVEKANSWINSSLEGDKQQKAYRRLVNQRRLLKRKMFAIEGNPAAAIYGESQVGKSYLISSLLSEEGSTFNIHGVDDTVYNFIEEINPPGGGSESTSLVSRFSVCYKPININYPVKSVLLTPADIVLVLCDSYYNDVKSSHELAYTVEQLNEKVQLQIAKYNTLNKKQNFLIEDELLDIADYFVSHLSKASNVLSSRFFNEIPLLIEKVEPRNWIDVFSLLWNGNEHFSSIFIRLIDEYEKIDFTKEIFLPIDSVLYRHGTLLDVQRLKELYDEPKKIEPQYVSDTTIMFLKNSVECTKSIQKSYLCALSAELIFSQPQKLIESKAFLEETDLLDFPGARSRMNIPEKLIDKNNVPEFLLRGKVAYLFNKYVEAERINLLLLCAKHEQTAQRTMPLMLNNWISKVIGESPESRTAFIQKSKIPPLFIIGTFFNVNLQFNNLLDRPNDDSSLRYRWQQRFVTTLSKELIETDTYAWLNNWTTEQPDFQNIFLLRDYVKSENPSNIYKGYYNNKKELELVVPENYPDFMEKLRASFLNHDFVKKHFADPIESWDRAASINEDGSELIISKLTLAAKNINAARFEKLQRELNALLFEMIAELNKYFHSNDKDQELQKAKSKAGNIQFKMNSAFSADGIKLYGQLMKELMISESEIFELFRNIIENIEHRDVVNLDIYSTHRINVPVNEDDTVESYFERLCQYYEKTTAEEKDAFRIEMEDMGIDLDVLINSNTDLVKNNAQQLADALLEHWCRYVTLNDKKVVHAVFNTHDTTTLHDLVEMYQKLFQKLNLSKKIADKIRKYVSGGNKTDFPYEIVADISSELLNKCINTVGYDYLDESEIVDLKLANVQNNLGLDFSENLTDNMDVAALLYRVDNWSDIIRRNPMEMRSSPNYQNYLAWYNRLKIGFVSVCDIPNYDLNANNKLKEIIDECATIKY